jgi:DNA-binding Lrp family transcriptional regulator
MVLDRIDFGILRLLQNDASLSNKEVAAAIGLAPSRAHERLKRLRQEGILRGFHADVAPKALGVSTQLSPSQRILGSMHQRS